MHRWCKVGRGAYINRYPDYLTCVFVLVAASMKYLLNVVNPFSVVDLATHVTTASSP